ncbi:MAG: 2-oxoacid:acceptor oxidoreductase subunit alpha [Lachnospiraceae bacterium]|nr:2-oxoacid:acceptor oxidoreductase subunit alpha [Lachnospiraceae bacterium]
MANVLMQGNEAVVEGAIAAGMRFFAGYPITPSTEIAEGASRRLPQVGGHFVQMEDELASMAAVIGASTTGAKSITATSGPGFSLKQENIGYACLAEIPCVIVDVQRCGPSTGLPTSPSQGDYMQARWGTHGDHPMIALSPSSVAETYRLAIRAFNLSEKYRTPVILLMDEIVGHMREGIRIPTPDEIEIVNRREAGNYGAYKFAYRVPEGKISLGMRPFGEGSRYNMTGLMHDYSGFPVNSPVITHELMERIMHKISDHLDDILETEEYRMEDAEYAVACFGGTARAARDAVDAAREQGIKAGMWRPVTVWPFPEESLKKAAANLKGILMAEHNYGQMLLEVERCVRGGVPIEFIGRVDGTVIPPSEILEKLQAMHAGGAEGHHAK